MADNVPISKRLVLINSTSSVITRLLQVGILGWLIQHLLKRVPPAEASLLPIVMAVTLLVPLLTVLIRGGLARFVTEAYARDDLTRVRKVTTTMVPIAAAGGVVLALGGVLFARYVHYLLNIDPGLVWDAQLMLGLVLSYMGLRLAFTPLTVGLEVRQKYVVNNAIQLINALVRLMLLLVLIVGISPRVLWVVVALVGAGLVEMALLTGLSMRALPPLRVTRGHFDWGVGREVMAFGFWVGVGQAGATIRRTADPFILNLLASPVAVTAFYLGWQLDEQVRRLMQTTTRPLLPVVTAMHARGEPQRLRHAFLRGTRLIMWISLAIATPLILFRHELLRLYLGQAYETYAEAGTVILLLLVAYPMVYVTSMVNKIAHATARMRRWMSRVYVIHMTNLALTFVLVGGFELGATGSALATCVAILGLHPLLLWPVGLGLTDTRLATFLRHGFGPGVMPALATAGAVSLGKWLVGPVGLAGLIGEMALALMIYGGCCIIAFSNQDRRESYLIIERVTSPMRKLFS